MTVFAYARVSTLDQSPEIQKIDLLKAYPEAVYREEKKSGTKKSNRDVLNLFLDLIKKGDKLVVWKLDRLARNMKDLSEIMEQFKEKEAPLEILDQKIDTETATGKAFLQMLGVFAEFETNLRYERQMAGIAAARKKGKHLGRKSLLTTRQKQEILVKKEAGINPTKLSKEYSVSRATIYSVLKNSGSNFKNGVLIGIDMDIEQRQSMAKLVTKLLDNWKLPVVDQLNLLGLSETSRAMLTKYRKGTAIPNSRDMRDRIALLLSIHKSLRLLYPYNQEFRYQWITKRNRMMDNLRPLDVMREKGLIGIATISRHLDLLRGQ